MTADIINFGDHQSAAAAETPEKIEERKRKRAKYTAVDPDRPWDVTSSRDGMSITDEIEDCFVRVREYLAAGNTDQAIGVLGWSAGHIKQAVQRAEEVKLRAERSEREKRRREKEREEIEREERRLARERDRARKRVEAETGGSA